MKNLPQLAFIVILVLYPLYSMIIYKWTGLSPNYLFGFICICFLTYQLYWIYKRNESLKLPLYLVFFGIFSIYVVVSNIVISDLFMEKGPVKYLYSSPYLATFIGLLTVENTTLERRWVKVAANTLWIVLLSAAVVSIIQLFDPLFMVNSDYVVQGLDYDRLSIYYDNNPSERSGAVSRFLEGYRYSIFSYIHDLSVGIDGMAIFSLLIAIRFKNKLFTGTTYAAAALISFLSSSRWIMLNFVIVASQSIWQNRTNVLLIFKYTLLGVLLTLSVFTVLDQMGFDFDTFIQNRLLSESAFSRVIAIEVFNEVYYDNPIFGTGGVDTPEVVQLLQGKSSQIHVGYLKLFYYYGLIGGLIYLCFCASFLIRLWKMARDSNFWGGFYAVLAFFMANFTLVRLDLFFHGIFLAILFSNYFFYYESQSSADYARIPGNRLHPRYQSD